jgi:pyruvate/2-oxoacid:ferredoxin oxidoreductase beta subunit
MSATVPFKRDFRNFDVPAWEGMDSGHLACAGCGATTAMRLVLKALGPRTIVVIPACCWAVIEGPFPYSALRVPVLQAAFETAAITASGVRAGLRARGVNDVTVCAFAGDGGTFDIGLQALSGAAERNEDILYVCYDNEAYMNTGIQRSSATPAGAWTATTPDGNARPKKDLMAILAAHHIPYAATATIAYPDDFLSKVKKAASVPGFKFIHVFSPCPTGHRTEESVGVELARRAVESRMFPLYETENGVRRLTVNPEPIPVREYLGMQGRFRNLDAGAAESLQDAVDESWEHFESPPGGCGAEGACPSGKEK